MHVTTWTPTTREELEALLEREIERLDADQLQIWKRCCISPRHAEITRYGKAEAVFVVAEHQGEGLYWEDVEEGFNLSPLGPDGEILEHWCNQDQLGWALNRWLYPDRPHDRLGPAVPREDLPSR